MTVFSAHFNSECFVCEKSISEGESVTWRDKQVVHEECVKKVPVADRPVAVCPNCFLALPVTGVCVDCA